MRFSLTKAVRSFVLSLPSTTPTHISAIYEEVNSPGNLNSETSPATHFFLSSLFQKNSIEHRWPALVFSTSKNHDAK
jgi:hypothetical protein